MSLNDIVGNSVLESVKEMNILSVDTYAQEHATSLHALYTQGVVDDSSLEQAIEQAIFTQAQWDFCAMMCLRGTEFPRYASQAGSKRCFAYALEHDKFSQEDIRKIPFDTGHTKDSYIQKYGQENFLLHLKDKLLNPPSTTQPKTSDRPLIKSSYR